MNKAKTAAVRPPGPPTNVRRVARGLQFNFPAALDLIRQAAGAFGGVAAIPTSPLNAPHGSIVAGIEVDHARAPIAACIGS
ncbi:MAG: hypothetical protein NFCOHLIN_00960 [Gammaproteobacteria bacterium]|nr:hypothetical protein [Gammaproteobacteria bacterium]